MNTIRDQRYDRGRIHALERVLGEMCQEPVIHNGQYWQCYFCRHMATGRYGVMPNPYPHDKFCPVLLARDLLTGIEFEESEA